MTGVGSFVRTSLRALRFLLVVVVDALAVTLDPDVGNAAGGVPGGGLVGSGDGGTVAAAKPHVKARRNRSLDAAATMKLVMASLPFSSQLRKLYTEITYQNNCLKEPTVL